jgi:hypothetical protein
MHVSFARYMPHERGKFNAVVHGNTTAKIHKTKEGPTNLIADPSLS